MVPRGHTGEACDLPVEVDPWRQGAPLVVLVGEGLIAGTVGSVPASVASLGFPGGGNRSPTRAVSPREPGPRPAPAPAPCARSAAAALASD